MKDGKLEVGDYVYSNTGWYGVRKVQIARLTPKFAVTDSHVRLHNIDEGRGKYPCFKEQGKYDDSWCYGNTELINKYEVQHKVSWVKNKKFSDEDYVKIYDMFNEK